MITWLQTSSLGYHPTKMGVSINGGTPSYHPFQWDFPLLSHSFWGSPMAMETPYRSCQRGDWLSSRDAFQGPCPRGPTRLLGLFPSRIAPEWRKSKTRPYQIAGYRSYVPLSILSIATLICIPSLFQLNLPKDKGKSHIA